MVRKDNKNPGYLLGRFIAVMTNDLPAKEQNRIVLKVVDTNPRFAAAPLLRESVSVDEPAKKLLIQEILADFSIDDLPDKVMDPPTMGNFFLGYYHQQAELDN